MSAETPRTMSTFEQLLLTRKYSHEVAFIEKVAKRIDGLVEERDRYKKRLTEQRRQIAGMSRKIEGLLAEAPPEPSAEDIAERQRVYIERIEAARQAGDVHWLADELIEQDREKQVLIAKNETNKQNLSSVRRLRSEKKGAEARAARAEAALQRATP